MTKRLLCVEDDKELQELYGEMLGGVDCEIIRAYDAIDGRQKLDNLRPDAVLLDILLGDVRGDVLFHWIRGAAETADLPVVVVSVLAAEQCGCFMELDGRTVFLRKPFRQEELRRAVEIALDLGRTKEG